MAYIKNTMNVLKSLEMLNELVGMKSAGEVAIADHDVIAVSYNNGTSIHLHLNNDTERWFKMLQDGRMGTIEVKRKYEMAQDNLRLTQNFCFIYKGMTVDLTFSA
jgi:hypothetical protein